MEKVVQICVSDFKSYNTPSLPNLKTRLAGQRLILWEYSCSQKGHKETKPLFQESFNTDHGSKGLEPKRIVRWPNPSLLVHTWKTQDMLSQSHKVTGLVMEKWNPRLLHSRSLHTTSDSFLHHLIHCLFFLPFQVYNFHILLRIYTLLQTSNFELHEKTNSIIFITANLGKQSQSMIYGNSWLKKQHKEFATFFVSFRIFFLNREERHCKCLLEMHRGARGTWEAFSFSL